MSRQRVKSVNHHCVVDQRLDIGHREVSLVLTCESPCHVYGGQGHVEVERERLFLPGLAVGEPGKLLAVPQQELDLEPCPVEVHDVLCRHLRVRGEEHLPGLRFLARFHAVGNDHTHIALQAGCPDDGCVESDRLAVVVVALFPEHVRAEIVKVHLPVHLLRPAPLSCLRAGIEILQADVAAETADQAEAQHGHAVGKGLLREERVGHDNVADLQQRVFLPCKRAEIPCRERVGVLHPRDVLGRTTRLDGVHRLDCLQVHGIPLVRVNHGDVKDLQPVLGCGGAAGPEVAHAGCMFAALVDEARVDGQGDAVLLHVGGEPAVVAHPVEPLPEVLSEAALAGVPEA